MEDKQCQECGRSFFGRSDKRFCSSECRTAFNNRSRRTDEELVIRVNRTLRKNRSILVALAPDGKAKATRDELLRKGFDLSYFTNVYVTKEKKEYRFCYEYGYLELDGGYFLIVKREPSET